MANNYLKFSEILKLENKDERDWAVDYLELLERIEESEAFPEDNPEYKERDPEYKEYERIVSLYDLQGGESGFDFSWSFDGDLELWIYADEGGNVDHVAIFVQEYLRKFHQDSCFAFTWSTTCDRMKVGEFGGGAAFITAEKIEWMNIYDWVQRKRDDFQDEQG